MSVNRSRWWNVHLRLWSILRLRKRILLDRATLTRYIVSIHLRQGKVLATLRTRI